MKKSRHFDPIAIPTGGGLRRVHRVTCCQCGSHNDVTANTYHGSRAHEDLFNVWRRRGWDLGSNEDRDLCPDCIGKDRQQEKPPMAEQKPSPAPAPAVAADPPRTMTREDRRLIFAKLQDVYLDERRGYENGWTDARVAKDLGVPLAWVKELRDQNFGPEGSNEEMRTALAAAGEFINAVETFDKDLTAARKQLDDLTATGKQLGEKARFIERQITGIERAVK